MHVASFVPEIGGSHLTVLIEEKSGDEYRAIFTLTKMAADFVNCMRAS